MKKLLVFMSVATIILGLCIGMVAYGAEGDVTMPNIPINPGDVTHYYTSEQNNPTLPSGDNPWEMDSTPFKPDGKSDDEKQSDGKKEETPAATPSAKTAKKRPKKTALKKAKKVKNKLVLKWKKVKGVSGYQIQYSTKKNNWKKAKKVTVKGAKKVSKTIKVKKNKKYYVRIRTYKGKGANRVYSKWTKAKLVK